MTLDKDTIKRSFSRAAESYDLSSSLQRDVAGELSALIAKKLHECHSTVNMELPATRYGDIILDAGCGTGGLTGFMKASFPKARIIGCDIALPMIRRFQENTGFDAVVSDFEALAFEDSVFDIVASSLTYQWALDYKKAFSESRRVLRPDGLLIFSTLGPRTLFELRESFSIDATVIDLKDTTALNNLLKEAGFEVLSIENRPLSRRYDDLRSLLKTLKNVGASPPLGNGVKRRDMEEASGTYSKKFPAAGGGILATYDIIYTAAKPY